ncbi:hypothetical protein [Marinomonas sp. 2405UD68-3]|uniref:hypothetical protein n=1 Tax=Marinomonas sp. 2405UD68-3 TaxID=3391835 RepID=UPI0039C9F8B6
MHSLPTSPSLYHCIKRFQCVGHQINQLTHNIESLLTNMMDKEECTQKHLRRLPWSYSDRENSSNWFYQDTYLSLPIVYRSHSNTTFFLNIQISLYGVGLNSPWINNTDPLVHVFFSDMTLSCENTFDIALIHDPRESITSINQRFFYWKKSHPPYQDWFFSVPLNQLQNNRSTLIKLIQPCLKLLKTPIENNQVPLVNHEINRFFKYSVITKSDT